jgi:hypothetical protein
MVLMMRLDLPKSVIGSLAQNEGMQIYVAKVSKNLSKRLTGFARYGKLMSTVANAGTGNNDMGWEVDVSAVYQLSSGTTLQLDFGQFTPGRFFTKHDPAYLAAGKLKFSF